MNICVAFLLLIGFLKQQQQQKMIVWLWYQIIPSYLDCYKLDISILSDVFHGFPKNCVVHQL